MLGSPQLVAIRAEEIHDVFPEVDLGALQPGQELHSLRPVQATPEAIQGAVLELDDKIRECPGQNRESTCSSLPELMSWLPPRWF